MKQLIIFLLFNSSILMVNAQSVGIGTATPNATSLLHLSSTSKGILIPQVSIDSLKDITSIPSPAHGLLVFNTTQPGVRNDMQRGFYYYNTFATTWIRLADNANDNPWTFGGLLGIKQRDTADGVELLDNYTGSSTNFNPKMKILKMIDSASLNAKNNITALVLTGVNRKTTAGWESRQKTSIVFENNYLTTSGASGSANNVAISSYLENNATAQNTQTNGLGFYVTAPPQNTATADTPSLAMFRHNVGIGAYPIDVNLVTEGRLQITGFSNGDQLSLRHPSSVNLKWGLYVSSIDSSLNFYSNGSLRANIDRVTGVYSALSDRNFKKDIVPLTPVLNTVMKLPPYYYRYLDTEVNGRRNLGFMAQDVLPYFPELVYTRYDRETGKPFYTLNYDGFGVIAIKAIQEQQKIIDELKNQVEASGTSELKLMVVQQQKLIEELSKRIDELEKKK